MKEEVSKEHQMGTQRVITNAFKQYTSDINNMLITCNRSQENNTSHWKEQKECLQCSHDPMSIC